MTRGAKWDTPAFVVVERIFLYLLGLLNLLGGVSAQAEMSFSHPCEREFHMPTAEYSRVRGQVFGTSFQEAQQANPLEALVLASQFGFQTSDDLRGVFEIHSAINRLIENASIEKLETILEMMGGTTLSAIEEEVEQTRTSGLSSRVTRKELIEKFQIKERARILNIREEHLVTVAELIYDTKEPEATLSELGLPTGAASDFPISFGKNGKKVWVLKLSERPAGHETRVRYGFFKTEEEAFLFSKTYYRDRLAHYLTLAVDLGERRVMEVILNQELRHLDLHALDQYYLTRQRYLSAPSEGLFFAPGDQEGELRVFGMIPLQETTKSPEMFLREKSRNPDLHISDVHFQILPNLEYGGVSRKVFTAVISKEMRQDRESDYERYRQALSLPYTSLWPEGRAQKQGIRMRMTAARMLGGEVQKYESAIEVLVDRINPESDRKEEVYEVLIEVVNALVRLSQTSDRKGGTYSLIIREAFEKFLSLTDDYPPDLQETLQLFLEQE